MANVNGFIKLHRKLIEWGWYSDSVVKDVFLHILMTATFKGSKYQGYELKPGQAVIGRKRLSTELGFTEQQIRTALKKLESTGEITLFSTNKFTIATVENWRTYQCDDNDSNQPITNNQPTNNQRITNEQPHYKNVKNVKKEKNVKNIIPPTIEMVADYITEKSLSVDAEYFVDFYGSKDWKVGKEKMKDWQCTLRNWHRNNLEKQSKSKSVDFMDL